MIADYQEVLDFWFGTLDDKGMASADQQKVWFIKSDALDEQIRARFGATLEALSGATEGSDPGADWLSSVHGQLAYIIVLDQFSRNLKRDTAAMYDNDKRAVQLAASAVDEKADRTLATCERSFVYMPFMHSEELVDQDRCVACFKALAESLDGDARKGIDNNVNYAIAHRDIVAEWGRFPHRNEILGRISTTDELVFLTKPGSSF